MRISVIKTILLRERLLSIMEIPILVRRNFILRHPQIVIKTTIDWCLLWYQITTSVIVLINFLIETRELIWCDDITTRVTHTNPPFIQLIAWCLFSAKPLPKPMKVYSIGPLETKFSEILSKLKHFHWQNCIWKCRLPKCWPSCARLNVLKAQKLANYTFSVHLLILRFVSNSPTSSGVNY